MAHVKAIGPMERFQNFLGSFQVETGEYKYRQRLSQLALSGANSLTVDFEDLLAFDLSLARSVMEEPDEYLKFADDAAWRQLKIEDPEYAEQTERIYIRFRGLPEPVPLRSMGSEHIGEMILVDGIVVRASAVQPLLTKAVFRCKRCGAPMEVEQTRNTLTYPDTCTNPDCGRRRPWFELVEKESNFINSQRLRIQERPEDLPPGQLPRWLDVKVLEDLVDVGRPGDRVSVTGVVRAQPIFSVRGGRLSTYELLLEANYIDVVGKEPEVVYISPDEEKQIMELAKDPMINAKLIRSIAPSIYGYETIKEAIMYLLFGGVPKSFPDGINVRGDANVLLIGDPGTAKSQLLQYVAKIAPRGLYTSGRGSTAAGLTAAVIRESGGGMTLEAGALVLADKGVCSIDEIDKMRPDDRVAIHEAMEQQTVSVAKGGIVATLNARSSILAAANPALGRYEPYRTVAENINLPVTILSRFDLIFVIRDVPQMEQDMRMAEHILSLHKARTPPVEAPIDPRLFRKFINYAKHIKPKLTDVAVGRLKEFYLDMRSKSESTESPVTITARQLEALIRLAEARARAGLHEEVTVEDAQAVILLMRKSLEQVGIDVSTGRPDIDVIMTGKPKSLRDKLQVVLSTIFEMERATGIVKDEELYERLERDFDIPRIEADRLVDQLMRDGTIYAPRPGYFKKT